VFFFCIQEYKKPSVEKEVHPITGLVSWVLTLELK